MSIKRFKIKKDPVSAEWYVLHKVLDLHSRWHWVIRHTAASHEEAAKVKAQMEKEVPHD